jgi:hypothetical protein
MKKNLYFERTLLMLVCLVPVTVSAQLYSNVFTGASACPTPGNMPVLAANATGTALTRNTLTCTSAANVFNSSAINNKAAVNDNSYIQFSVTADAGYELNLTSLSFFSQGSPTAPNQMEVRYSTDGFITSTTWGAAPKTLTSPGATSTWDFTDFTSLAGITVTFRFYPFGTQRADLSSTPASASATLRLDNITLNGSVLAPMPVKLISFNGDFDRNLIFLQWETAWEEQNEGFEIQKSSNAVHFDKIGYVKGNLTVKSKSVYGFTDTEIMQGQTAYFRLKQYDVDGSFTFSRIISVNTGSAMEEPVSIFPNPNIGIFTLNARNVSFLNTRFFNAQGKEVPVRISSTENPGAFQINTCNRLAPGLYELKTKTNSRSKSVRVVIVQ